MATERTGFETEVRELVARVLQGVLDEPSATRTSRQPSDPGHTDQRIAIGADHGGYPLKESLKANLLDAGWAVEDCGTDSTDACDYPKFAHAVARQVATGKCAAGIMIDGAGIGSAMTANKVPGVRAAACYDLSTARNSREHNRANVLTLGAGLTGAGLAWQITEEWLATPWGTGRHHQRVALIDEIEALYVTSDA